MHPSPFEPNPPLEKTLVAKARPPTVTLGVSPSPNLSAHPLSLLAGLAMHGYEVIEKQRRQHRGAGNPI